MNRWSEKKQKNRIKTQFRKNPMDMENWESLQLRMHEIEMYEQRRRKAFTYRETKRKLLFAIVSDG